MNVNVEILKFLNNNTKVIIIDMISIPQWIALLLFYMAYLLVGAAVFLGTESQHETDSLKMLHKLQTRLTGNTCIFEYFHVA